MTGGREDWFPTPVWAFDHPDPGPLNAALLGLIAAERAADPAGVGRSSVLGWHSRDDLHTRPPFAPLVAFLEAAVGRAVADLRWDPAVLAPRIANCWAIVNGRHAGNVVHTHPLCFLSGVYYVRAAAGAGDLFFHDPRSAAVASAVPVAGHTPLTYRKVTYAPRPGRVLVFPAWLPHGVDPNLGDEDRVCVGFNVGARWR